MEKNNEQLYIKGFNQGYQMSRYEPEALNGVLSVENEWNVFVKGLKAGQEQYFKEAAIKKHVKPEISKEERYKKAFNQGYYYAKYQSQFEINKSDLMLDKSSSNAFKAGMVQYDVDRFDQRSLPSMNKGKSPKNDKTPDKSFDDRDVEPEL